MTDLASLDATAQADLVRSGDAQPIELVDAAIARIESINDELNAVIHPLFDRARAAANGLTAREDGRPFAGVPGAFERTHGRRDYTLTPPSPSHLGALREAGIAVHGVGKVTELFDPDSFSAAHAGAV